MCVKKEEERRMRGYSSIPTQAPIIQSFENIKENDSIEMGYYSQSSDTDKMKEPIKWKVLTVDKKEQKALLLSEYGLDAVSFGKAMDTNEYMTAGLNWENSYIRKWLNEEFYANVFTDSEKERILGTTNTTSDRSGKFIMDDTLFLLSVNDVKRYLKNPKGMACRATEYAKKSLKLDQGAITDDNYCMWWVRDMLNVAKVDKNGNFMKNTGNEAGYIYGSKGLQSVNKKRDVLCSAII